MSYIARSLAGFLSLLVILFSVTNVYAAVSWEETRPGGDTIYSWTPSAISSDGQKILAGNQGGDLFFSSDGGNNWMEIDPSGTGFDMTWYRASMSSDGEIMLATVYGGRLYISTNGGDSWSETRPAGNSDYFWITTSMSADGEVLLVGIEDGRLYLSTNGGDTWSETQPAGNTNIAWTSSAVSSDGQVLIAGSNGRIYRSTNTGGAWSEIQPIGNRDQSWNTVGMSADGEVIVAGTNEKIHLSTNSGDTWTEIRPAGDANKTWRTAAVASDGQNILAGESERIYFSSDGGNSWSETQPAGNTNLDWNLGTISGDGQTLLAGVYDGRLYLGAYEPDPSNNSVYYPPAGFGPPSCNDSAPSSAPDLFKVDTAGTYVNLYFSTISGGTGYNVNYGLNNQANQYGDLFNYSGDAWTYGRTISGLLPNTTYYFRVQGVNGCNAGGWSQTVSVKTKYKNSILNQWFANLAK